MFFDAFVESFPVVCEGLWLTVFVTFAAFIVGQVCALFLGLGLCAKSPLLSVPASIYTFLVRGSPLLVQLLLIYSGIPQLGFVQSTFLKDIFNNREFCAILAVGLNSAAYMAEVVAGALRKVPEGQLEASISLGLSRRSRLFDVLLPQVYRALLPQIGNEMILVLKGSSLVAAITLVDITNAAKGFVALNYTPFATFTAAGILYLAIGIVISILFKLLERLYPIAPLSTSRKELKAAL